jgi:hypothetical protein
MFRLETDADGTTIMGRLTELEGLSLCTALDNVKTESMVPPPVEVTASYLRSIL